MSLKYEPASEPLHISDASRVAVKLLLLRSAGFNHVDLVAAEAAGISVSERASERARDREGESEGERERESVREIGRKRARERESERERARERESGFNHVDLVAAEAAGILVKPKPKP